jgi:hypothetical protein
MGGSSDELRGPTKLDVWLQLKDLFEAHANDAWTVRPSNKREAMSRMTREYPSRDWVLPIRFDK